VTGADHRLLVPTTAGLLLVDGTSGEVIERNGSDVWSIPLMIGSEVLISTANGIRSYVPYEVGEPALRAQIEGHPDDPNPAIDLLTMAARHGRLEVIADHADLAIEIINRDSFSVESELARQRLFDRLLEIAVDPAIERADVAEGFFKRLDLMTATVVQRAAYLLAYGSWLEERGRLREAVDSYQAVIENDSLGSVLWEAPVGRVRARIEATGRLVHLLSANRGDLYAVYADAAADEYERIVLESYPDVDRLLALADRYPVCVTAGRSCLKAGILLAGRGQTGRAVGVLRRGLDLVRPESGFDDGDVALLHGELLGLLVSLLEEMDSFDEALRVLDSALQRWPTMRVISPDGLSRDLVEWKAALIALADVDDALAVIRDFSVDQPVVQIPGDDLLQPRFGSPSRRAALVVSEEVLYALGCENLEVLWSRPMDWSDVELVSVERATEQRGECVLLGSWGITRYERLMLVSLETGKTIWSFDDGALRERMVTGGEGLIVPEELDRRSPHRRYPPSRPDLPPALGAHEVVMVDPAGFVICLERATGDVRWATLTPLEFVSHVECDPDRVVVTGLVREFVDEAGQLLSESAHVSARILVLNPVDGAIEVEVGLDEGEQVKWMRIADPGRLLYATEETVSCYDLMRNEVRWEIDGSEFNLALGPMIAGRFLLLVDGDGVLVQVDVETGGLRRFTDIIVEQRPGSDVVLMQAERFDILKTADGVHVFDGDGEVIGRSARIGTAIGSITTIAVAGERIVVLERRNEADPESKYSRRPLYLYHLDLTGKRVTAEVFAEGEPPLVKANGVQVIDGWVLVDTNRGLLGFVVR